MGKFIDINTADGSFKAYAARARAPNAPSVVVMQEIFGVNADIRATCDELASKGYNAVSPDLFWRIERGVDMSDRTDAEWTKGMALYTAFDYDAGVRDIAATIKATRELPGASGKVGLMGFCLGGLLTFLTTARSGADASVVYYGGNTDQHLDEASLVKTPLLMHLAEEDEYIPKAAREAIVEALHGNNRTQIFTYPGCSHAFARHRGAHYNREAATLANDRTAAFFKLHLG